MLYRRIPNAQVDLSAISLGITDRTPDPPSFLRAASDLGITSFNLVHADPSVQDAVARFLKDSPSIRHAVHLASAMNAAPDQPLSIPSIHAAIDRTRQRLGIDTISLFLLRNVRRPQFDALPFDALHQAQTQGKIRAWGVALGPGIGWREEGLSAMLDHHASLVQSSFDLFQQNPGQELCETAVATRAGVLAWTEIPLDQQPWTRTPARLRKLGAASRFAADLGMTLDQLTFKWLLRHRGLVSVSATFGNTHAMQQFVQVLDTPDLTTAELTEIAAHHLSHWGQGEAARPPDLSSSVDPSGRTPAHYVPPPVLLT